MKSVEKSKLIDPNISHFSVDRVPHRHPEQDVRDTSPVKQMLVQHKNYALMLNYFIVFTQIISREFIVDFSWVG